MSNLGTLWFGADIDLSNLKQKIQSGNKEIVDALKIDFNPASFQQMVSKLRSDLSKEVFEVKIKADTSAIHGSQRHGTNHASPFNLHNIQVAQTGFAGINREVNDIDRKILDQKDHVRDLAYTVVQLREKWNDMSSRYGRKDSRTTDAYNEFAAAKKALQEERTILFSLQQDRARANLTLREQRAAYKESTTAMRQQAQAARELNNESIRLNTTLANGVHISTRFGSALSSLFAVHYLRQFLDNVIEIGGQLEKQRISMQAIIGDTARANELFEQIKGMAIKSPFGVVELDQYSKQLAAYGIEQSNLFDMTKRLADISAGAGQDIGRLALALGHVKSATYLTGITLRQFSMNNIPMLKMLADYYSEVEKRAVSTAEVQKRISQRQVSYEDVLEQIKRMTDEGGTFYNMQEKITESLAAKFKNLRDSFDIMYGEIAESKIGDMLKGFAGAATELSRNWEQAVGVIAVAIAQFGVMRVASLASSNAVTAYSASVGRLAVMKRMLTAEEVEELVINRQLTKQQLLNAVACGRLSAWQAKLAASYFHVNEAQLQQIATSGKVNAGLVSNAIATSNFSVAQLRMIANMRIAQTTVIALGGRFKWLQGTLISLRVAGMGFVNTLKTIKATLGALAPQIALFAGMSAVFDIFMNNSRKAEEAEERLNRMSERANEGFRNVRELREKYSQGMSGEMSAGDMENAITEMTESLKSYSLVYKKVFNDAFAVDEQGKAVHTLAQQYEILADAVAATEDSYKTLDQMRHSLNALIEDANKFKGGAIQELGETLFGWLFSPDKSGDGIELKGLSDQVKTLNAVLKEAAHVENDFAKHRLEFINALEQMNVEGAAAMSDKDLLAKLEDWGSYPKKYKELTQLVSSEAKSSYDEMIKTWQLIDRTFYSTSKSVEDLGQKIFDQLANRYHTSDMSKWPPEWRNLVALAMEEALGSVEGFANMSIDEQNRLRNALLQPFDVTVNTDEAMQHVTALRQELEALVGRGWMVQIGITGVDVIADATKAGEAYTKYAERLEKASKQMANLEKRGLKNTEAYRSLQNEIVDINAGMLNSKELNWNLGGDLPTPKGKGGGGGKKGGGGSKTDTVAKAMSERVNILKDAYTEYKKWLGLISKDEALKKVQESGLFAPLFGGDSPVNLDDYANELRKIQKQLDTSKPSQRKVSENISKILLGMDYDAAKEQADKAILLLNTAMDEITKQWDLYKSLLNKTGSRDYAMNAMTRGLLWDEKTRALAERLRNESGKGNISFGMSAAEAKDFFGDGDMGKAFYEQWKKIVDLLENNYKKSLEDGADAIAKTLSVEEKIEKIEQEIARLKSEEANMAGTAARISALEIDKWKLENNWDRVFGDLDNMSLPTIKRMITAIRKLQSVTSMEAEEMKIWEEAITKLTDKATVLDPIQALADAIAKMKETGARRQNAENILGMTKETLATLEEALKNAPDDPELLAKYAAAQADVAAAQRDVDNAIDDSTAAINSFKKAVAALADIIGDIGSSISGLGSAIGGNFGDILKGIGSMFGTVSSALDKLKNWNPNATGLAKVQQNVGVILGVVSAMIELNKQLAKILPNSENRYEKYAQKAREVNLLREAVDEYRRSVVAAHAAEGEWFAGNSLSNLRAEGEKAKETMTAYYKELYEAQEQYKNKGAGWKKAIVPLAAAASAVVAAFTLGAGTPALMAAWGAALSLGTVTGTIVGGAVAAGIGYAIGQIAQSAVEGITYGKGQIAARDNMRIQTRHKSFWRGQKTANLEEWVRKELGAELFDGEGLINLEAAQQVLEKYGDKLVGDTKETLERLVELRKEYDEFIKQIEDYVGEIGTSLAESMTNAIWDWLIDGENALDKFKEYASDTWKEIASDIIKTFMKVTILDNYSDLFKELFKGWSLGGISDEALISSVAALSGQIATDFENIIPMAQKIAESLNTAFRGAGYDITGKGGSSSSRVIKGEFNENETGLVLSYMNGIRADLAMQRTDVNVIRTTIEIISQRQNVIAESQIQQLRLIADNTLRNANAADSILQILSMATKDPSFGFNVK